MLNFLEIVAPKNYPVAEMMSDSTSPLYLVPPTRVLFSQETQ